MCPFCKKLGILKFWSFIAWASVQYYLLSTMQWLESIDFMIRILLTFLTNSAVICFFCSENQRHLIQLFFIGRKNSWRILIGILQKLWNEILEQLTLTKCDYLSNAGFMFFCRFFEPYRGLFRILILWVMSVIKIFI